MQHFREEGRRRVRIRCAASSSGEEPYTIAMTAAESLDLRQTDFKLLATDISTKVLQMASNGVYSDKHLEKVPLALKAKYFERRDGIAGEEYSVSETLRSLVVFKRLNLSVFPYPLKGPLDIIFCRNVMIYFDNQLRGKIVAEFERLLSPGGHLFLSHSENLLSVTHKLLGRQNSIYQKKGN